MIVSGPWKIVKFEEKEGNGAYMDVSSDYEPCERDNLIEFYSDKTFIEDEGKLKCDPSDDQNEKGVLDLSLDYTKIIVEGEDYLIEKINADTFIFVNVYYDTFDKVTYYGRSTLKK